MGTVNTEVAVTKLSAADYSTTGQYLFGVMSSAGTVAKIVSQGADADGVISNNPEAGQPLRLVIGGLTKVLAGDTITVGAKLTTGADGRAENAASGDHVVARAYQSGVDGEVIEIKLGSNMLLP